MLNISEPETVFEYEEMEEVRIDLGLEWKGVKAIKIKSGIEGEIIIEYGT